MSSDYFNTITDSQYFVQSRHGIYKPPPPPLKNRLYLLSPRQSSRSPSPSFRNFSPSSPLRSLQKLKDRRNTHILTKREINAKSLNKFGRTLSNASQYSSSSSLKTIRSFKASDDMAFLVSVTGREQTLLPRLKTRRQQNKSEYFQNRPGKKALKMVKDLCGHYATENSKKNLQPFYNSGPAPIIKKTIEIPSNLDKYITLLEKDLVSDEFIYLQYKSEGNYYDLQPTDFRRLGKNYFTLSRLGLTYFEKVKPKQFIPLNEWLKDRKGYYKTRTLRISETFKKLKILKRWRKAVRYEQFEDATRRLRENLFILNPQYRENILFIRRVLVPLETRQLILIERCHIPVSLINSSILDQSNTSFQSVATYDLAEFQQRQFQNQKTILQTIQNSSTVLHQKVQELFHQKLQSTKQLHKPYNKEDSIIESQTRNSKAFRYFGFVYELMSYEEKLEVKEQCHRIIRYTYLADFLIMNILDALFKHSVRKMLAALFEIQYQIPQIKKLIGSLQKKEHPLHTPPFLYNFKPVERFIRPQPKQICRVLGENKGDRMFRMQEEMQQFVEQYTRQVHLIAVEDMQKPPQLGQYLQSLIKQGITALNHFQRFSKHPQMIPYIAILEEWDERITENWGEVGCIKPQEFVNYNWLSYKMGQISTLLSSSTNLVWADVKYQCESLFSLDNINKTLIETGGGLHKNSYSQSLSLVQLGDSLCTLIEYLDWIVEQYLQDLPAYFIRGVWKVDTTEWSTVFRRRVTVLNDSLVEYCLEILMKKYYKNCMVYLTEGLKFIRMDLTFKEIAQSETFNKIREDFPMQKDNVYTLVQILDKLQNRGVKGVREKTGQLINQLLTFENNMNHIMFKYNSEQPSKDD